MSLAYEQITAAAMKLTAEERIALAERLWGSVESAQAVADAWDAEIARRVAELDAGTVNTVDADDVIAELRAVLK